MNEWLEFIKAFGPAVFAGLGAYVAIRVEVAELRAKMKRAEDDIQILFTLHRSNPK